MLKVAYRITVLDHLRLIWTHNTRSAVLLSLYAGCSLFLVWSAGWDTAMEKGSWGMGLIVLFFVSLILFAGFCLLGFVGAALASLSRRNKTFLTDHTMELHDDGFVIENKYGRSEMKWDVIQKVIRTRRSLLLYVTGSTALIVPRRAFQTQGDWEAFLAEVSAHRKR